LARRPEIRRRIPCSGRVRREKRAYGIARRAATAITIPAPYPNRATFGNRRTCGLIQDQPPDISVASYEPVIQGRYFDFTLLADLFGLLGVEVNQRGP
jgi:hypothetical protein